MAFENKTHGAPGVPPSAQEMSPEKSTEKSQEKPAEKIKKPRGLAAASPETRRAVARRGGEAVSKNRKHMAEIGRKGGEAVSQDRGHMAEIGRKGGEAVSQNREHMAEIGRKGGEARSGHGYQEESGLQESMLGESESEDKEPGQGGSSDQ